MNPDDQQEDRLQDAECWRVYPEFEQFLLVTLLESELAQRNAGADEMIGEEKRNRKAEHELRRFEPGPAEMTPRIERPEAEAHMGEERQIKDSPA